MNNHKPPNRFRSPLFGWSGRLSLPMLILSLMFNWPPILQFFFGLAALLYFFAQLAYPYLPHIRKIFNDRTTRRIREADADAMRSNRVQTFYNTFTNLISHASEMSDSQYEETLKLLTKFYIVEDLPIVDEDSPPKNNIVYLSSSPITTSPPEIHTLSNKKRRT